MPILALACVANAMLHCQATDQRLPAKLSSISVSVGASVLDLSNEYIDITKPGVQKPHWEPCALARRA